VLITISGGAECLVFITDVKWVDFFVVGDQGGVNCGAKTGSYLKASGKIRRFN